MLVSSFFLTEFECEIAEKAIEMLYDAFGSDLEILIGRRERDNATNLEFSYNDIYYSIKIFEEDDLIICGIQSFEYKEKYFNDADLFISTAIRHSLNGAEDCLKIFIHYLLSDRYFYVRKILSQLTELISQVDIKNSEQNSFLGGAIKFLVESENK